jgi:hypothetical protein
VRILVITFGGERQRVISDLSVSVESFDSVSLLYACGLEEVGAKDGCFVLSAVKSEIFQICIHGHSSEVLFHELKRVESQPGSLRRSNLSTITFLDQVDKLLESDLLTATERELTMANVREHVCNS